MIKNGQAVYGRTRKYAMNAVRPGAAGALARGSRRPGRTAGLAAAALAVAQAGPGITALRPVRERFFPRLSGQGLPNHVALTFDDGPDPMTTPLFIGALAGRGIHATFFMLGSRVAREPGLAAEVAAAGHDIGVHGWEHTFLPLQGPRATLADLARARDVIAEATGRVPRLFRPPYGVLTSAALVGARSLGLTCVLWTCWGREWVPGADTASVYATLVGGLAGGGTVLLHDSDATSPAGSSSVALGALPALLDECARRRLRVGPLGEHGPAWATPAAEARPG